MQDVVAALYAQYPNLDKEENRMKRKNDEREDEMKQVFAAAAIYAADQEARNHLAEARKTRHKPKVLSTHFTGVSQTQLSKFEKEVVLYQDGKAIDSTVESSVNTQVYTEE